MVIKGYKMAVSGSLGLIWLSSRSLKTTVRSEHCEDVKFNKNILTDLVAKSNKIF